MTSKNTIKLTDINGRMIQKGDILISRELNNSEMFQHKYSPSAPQFIVQDDFQIHITGTDDIVPITQIFRPDCTTPLEIVGNIKDKTNDN